MPTTALSAAAGQHARCAKECQAAGRRGKVVSAVRLEIPRYRQLMETFFSMIGHPLGEFHGYRVKIAYPAYPTALVMGYPLPEKENV